MSSPPSVLVYDGRKQVFHTAVDAFTYGMDDLVAVPWESAPIQAFLEAQFGGRPFVFLLIEDDTVHAGEAAVKRALTARGIGRPAASAFERLYATIGDPFGKVVHGEAPADIHGTYALEPGAREHLEGVRAEKTDADGEK